MLLKNLKINIKLQNIDSLFNEMAVNYKY
jgi:hypothetical protein